MWTETENQIKLILIRHGKTAGNAEHRYIGRTDEPLSSRGIRELQEKKEAGIFPKIDALWTSPKTRCQMTARIVYPEQDPKVIPQFTEIDFGDFEGKCYEELKEDERYQAWIDSGGTTPFPHGESRETYVDRVQEGFRQVWEEIWKEEHILPETIGIIAHGGTIMALLSVYGTKEYFEYQVENSDGYLVTITGTRNHFLFQEIKKIS